jgi:Tfp pilus assembly protein PilN
MPDWNKEIKLSGLFHRRKKAPKEAVADAVAPPEPAGEKSVLKKEISFSLRRRDKEPKEPKAPRLPKPSRAERRAAKQEARTTARADKAQRRKSPKEPRRARRQAPPAPAVPVMRAFNLLPRDDSRAGGGRRPSTAQLALAVVALVAFAALGAYFLMLNASVADRRAEADSLRTAAAARPNPAVPEPSPDDETNSELQQEQQVRTAALAGALGRRVGWDRLLREFSLVVPDDVSLTKLTASGVGAAADPAAPAGTPAPESTFTIEGYTKSQEGVARLLARLSVLPELSAVDLESSTATELGSAKVKVYQFVIRTIVKPVSGSTL